MTSAENDGACALLGQHVERELTRLLAELGGLQRHLRNGQRADRAGLDDVLERQRSYLEQARRGVLDLAGRPMRVVLMGRTQAGKSTLFCALTGAPATSSAGERRPPLGRCTHAPRSALPRWRSSTRRAWGRRTGLRTGRSRWTRRGTRTWSCRCRELAGHVSDLYAELGSADVELAARLKDAQQERHDVSEALADLNRRARAGLLSLRPGPAAVGA